MSRPPKPSSSFATAKSSSSSTSASGTGTAPAWRSAPDNFSYQKNQKFAVRSDADIESAKKPFNPNNEKLLKPVFAKESTLVKPNTTPATATSSSSASIPVVVISSKNMKASAPISRGAVQVVDAQSKLKQYDAEAKELNAPKVKVKPVKVQQENMQTVNLSDKAMFAATSAEVEALGSTGLNKWDRKVYQAQQDKLLGLKPLKAPKTPIKMMVGMLNKKDERAKRKRDSDREQGLQVQSEASISEAKRQKREEADNAADDEAGGWRMNIGRSHRGGVLSLGRSEIMKVLGRGGRGGRGGFRGRGRGRGR